MAWDGNKPGTLPGVADERLAEFAADRTGFEAIQGQRAMTDLELLAVVDELRAWRKYKLTDEEKELLRGFATYVKENVAPQPAVERTLVVLERMTGKAKSDG